MGEKKIKRKGYTLLEVILSVALIALLLIPISNMIMTAMKSSKRADIRQDGAVVGQQVLEELKTYDNLDLATNTPINLLDGETRFDKVLASSTATQTVYSGSMKDGKQTYEVNVLVEKDNNFNGYMAATTTASNKPDTDYSCILNLKTDGTQNKVYFNGAGTEANIPYYAGNETKLLLYVRRTGSNLTLKLYDYTSGNAVKATPLCETTVNDYDATNNTTKNLVKIAIDESFTGRNNGRNPGVIPIIVDSDSTGLVFDIVKGKNAEGKISVTSSLPISNISFDGTLQQSSKETFTARQNIQKQSTEDITAIGDLYKITVVVKDKGEEIFRSQVSNNLN